MNNGIEINLPIKDQYDVENLILGHFNLIHYGHYLLFQKLSNFSFLIFKNNPNKLKAPYSLEERINNLSFYKPDYIFIYDIFKYNIAPLEFINQVLLKLNPKMITVGSDFLFGTNKSGGINLLKKYFNLNVIEREKEYSTTNIVSLLEDGDFEGANKKLTFNFYYCGHVIKGKGLASNLKTPTANIEDYKNLKVKNGSYISCVQIGNKLYKAISFIGIPKSFELNKSFVETHIFDFNQNIYCEKIKVYPLKFIRENQKFSDFKQLSNAIENDCKIARNFFKDFDINKINIFPF
ncbi:MAG: bifunctional riboflavin kinase/FMN adenylyltransferase [Malacoplasma sp.]|nr:bifunctional riboflavin kinase/FMN adenylyltransferase [Malacoplasma sp.]